MSNLILHVPVVTNYSYRGTWGTREDILITFFVKSQNSSIIFKLKFRVYLLKKKKKKALWSTWISFDISFKNVLYFCFTNNLKEIKGINRWILVGIDKNSGHLIKKRLS